ncbi:MAG: GNAT family N-acetyltransferase [Ruminococcaceae bacterium]|nr:GNAT family N-acetyltransferase [Oscillospiraceae bacterium]
MYLTKDRLTIRNAGPADAATLCRWWNDGAVMAHAGFPNGLGTTEEAIREKLRSDSDETSRRLMIERDGTPIGEMSFHNLGEGRVEIGIKICEATEQEKGYGTTLLRMLFHALYQELCYQIIQIDTNLSNTRAQHVYEKLGAIKTGVYYDNWRNQLGELQSQVVYELPQAVFYENNPICREW